MWLNPVTYARFLLAGPETRHDLISEAELASVKFDLRREAQQFILTAESLVASEQAFSRSLVLALVEARASSEEQQARIMARLQAETERAGRAEALVHTKARLLADERASSIFLAVQNTVYEDRLKRREEEITAQTLQLGIEIQLLRQELVDQDVRHETELAVLRHTRKQEADNDRATHQAAQVRHSTEVDEARRKYLELQHELQHVDSVLQAHYKSANVVQLQLQQVELQASSSSAALSDKTAEAAALKTELEQLRHEFEVSRPTAGVGPDAFPRAEEGGGGGASPSPLPTGGPPKTQKNAESGAAVSKATASKAFPARGMHLSRARTAAESGSKSEHESGAVCGSESGSWVESETSYDSVSEDGSQSFTHSQVAMELFLQMPGRDAEPSAYEFPSRTSQLASADMEQRIMLQTPLEQKGMWVWKRSAYSPRVRLLEKINGVDVGLLGQGLNGGVYYAEMLGSDGIARPCAVKTVSYSTRLEQDRVCSELTALKAALDEPHLVQCQGVFPSKRPNGKPALVIVTEYVPGVSLTQALAESQRFWAADPDRADKHVEAAKVIGRHILTGLLSLHQQGRAHGDIKPDNIRVLLGADGMVLHCTLVDLGGSVEYRGPFCEKPDTMMITPDCACPVIARLRSTHDHASEEIIDVMAHDIHCAGCVLLHCLTGIRIFSPDDSAGTCADAVWASVAEKHMSWDAVYDIPGRLSPDAHPALRGLFDVSSNCDEYDTMCYLLMQMLFPELEWRATVEEALEDEFFADV